MRYADDTRIDSYNQWQLTQEIPIHTGFFIEELKNVELPPWDLKGGWRYHFVALSDDRPVDVSVKEGGAQIEYEDEDPEIHEIFEQALAKVGASCRMGAMVPWCKG
ncbi:MAG: hypothetical protein HYT78_02055 [Deltaproteobacteria bacterium]|nr:hypothetical protein [Deltaproteobacteria bacterium]